MASSPRSLLFLAGLVLGPACVGSVVGGSSGEGFYSAPDPDGLGGSGGRAAGGSGGQAAVVWRRANLTWFTSYPEPGSPEWNDYNGGMWAGYFAFVSGKQPESWVSSNNIAAVRSDHAETYKLKTLRLRQGTRQIDVKVYDKCADSDCNGCCTANSRETGFLIDLESYTKERFGSGDGIVEWICLDCP